MRFCFDGSQMIEYLPQAVEFDSIVQLDNWMTKLKKYASIVRLHFSKHKVVYRIGAITVVFILAAATGVSADALGSPAGDIDRTVNSLYKELLKVGKWAIIIKGAFDTVSNTIQGDFVAARKNAFAYMLVYVILLGLPWVFEKIEDVFQGVM